MIVQINSVNYTPIAPPCIERTLDESFDRAHIVLKYIDVAKPFAPFTPAYIDGEKWLVAQDNVTETVGAGKKRFSHDIILVEETIILTRMLSAAKTFTKILRVIDLDIPQEAPYRVTSNGVVMPSANVTFTNPFVTPYYIDAVSRITVPSINLLFTPPSGGAIGAYTGTEEQGTIGLSISLNGQFQYGFNPTQALTHETTLSLQLGTWKIIYFFDTYLTATPWDHTPGEIEFEFIVKQAASKPDDYTITEVVNSLLATATPIRYGESVSITFDAAQAAKYANTPAPEFSFANGQSLWEMLLEVGKVIRGIPRLVNGVLKYDLLGGTEYATIKGNPITGTESVTMDRYCSAIEGIVDNVVSESIYSGSIRDPASTTLRATTENVRINEETGLIQTLFPIESVTSIKCGYKQGENPRVNAGDITPYLYEKTLYNLLSSYGTASTASKAYAIYYTQGSRNIEGLFFKQPDVTSGAFKQYAIANLIEAVTEDNIFNIWTNANYYNLDFEVTYIPIISVRARQHKTGTGYHNTVIAYNQTADKVSSNLLGKAMRGQVAMMTNADKSLTYKFKSLSDVPECGTLYDDTYYVSRTATEIYPRDVKCTISLQANYNRISQYVALPNRVRQFEVSEKNVYDRHILYEDYCVLGDYEGNNNALLTEFGRGYIATALDIQSNFKPMQTAIVTMLTNNMGMVAYSCVLPVIGMPFGNSLLWSFAYEDNYSAGRKSKQANNGTNTAYRVQDYVPYTDYYGRAEYMRIGFYNYVIAQSGYESVVGHALPAYPEKGLTKGALLATTGDSPILIKKDGRERIMFAYQLHFVSNRDDLIIGEHFAEIMSLVAETGVTGKARLYTYGYRINQFTGTTNTATWRATLVFGAYGDVRYIDCDAPVAGVSWAIIKDGKFMIGGNGQFRRIYFNFRHLPKKDVVYSATDPYQEFPEGVEEEGPPPPTVYNIEYNHANIVISNKQATISPDTDYYTTLYTTGSYRVPDSIAITVNGSPISSGYTYTKTSNTTATLSIPASTITGDMSISAYGSAAVEYTLTVDVTDPDINGRLFVKSDNTEYEVEQSSPLYLPVQLGQSVQFIWRSTSFYTTLRFPEPDGDVYVQLVPQPLTHEARYTYYIQGNRTVTHTETEITATRTLWLSGTEEGADYSEQNIVLGMVYGVNEVQHILTNEFVGDTGTSWSGIPNGITVKFYWPTSNEGHADIALWRQSTGATTNYTLHAGNSPLAFTMDTTLSALIKTYHD